MLRKLVELNFVPLLPIYSLNSVLLFSYGRPFQQSGRIHGGARGRSPHKRLLA